MGAFVMRAKGICVMNLVEIAHVRMCNGITNLIDWVRFQCWLTISNDWDGKQM